MKIIIEAKNLRDLNKYNADGIIFSYTKFYTYTKNGYSLDEIKKIVKRIKKNNKYAILKIDKIIEEKEIVDLYNFLDEIIKLDIDYYIYSDVAILNYFEKNNLCDKLIFSAKTLNCSIEDIKYYQNKKIKVIISNELSIEEVKKITNLDNVIIDSYGYSLIFYSKRPLLSLYKEHIKIKDDLRGKLFTINEINKDDKYPIYENQNGTFIFSSSRYVLFDELKELNDNLMIKLESIFIDDKELIKILNIYKDYKSYNYNDLLQINSNISPNFLYKKARILKYNDDE